MVQPERIQDTAGGRPSFARRPIVLARLPHVGLGIDVPRTAPPSLSKSAFEQERSPDMRHFVDPQHTKSATTAPADPATTPAPLPDVTAPVIDRPQPRYQRHQAHPQHQSRTAPAREPASPGVTRLQTEVASYSGLIVTLALVASALLMYFTIIVPAQSPADDFENNFDLYGLRSSPAPAFQPPAQESLEQQISEQAQIASNNMPPAPLIIRAEEQELTLDLPAPEEEPVPQEEPGATWEEILNAEEEAEPEPDSADSISIEPPAEVQPKLIELPALDSEDSPGITIIYNDASASIYPETARPDLDLTKLGVESLSEEFEQSTTTTAEPAMASRIELQSMPPVSR